MVVHRCDLRTHDTLEITKSNKAPVRGLPIDRMLGMCCCLIVCWRRNIAAQRYSIILTSVALRVIRYEASAKVTFGSRVEIFPKSPPSRGFQPTKAIVLL